MLSKLHIWFMTTVLRFFGYNWYCPTCDCAGYGKPHHTNNSIYFHNGCSGNAIVLKEVD